MDSTDPLEKVVWGDDCPERLSDLPQTMVNPFSFCVPECVMLHQKG